MPFNPLMVNNKKLNIPKEKPKSRKKGLRERVLCWARLLMSSLLAGGKCLICLMSDHQLWADILTYY